MVNKTVKTILDREGIDLLDKYCETNKCSRYKAARTLIEDSLNKLTLEQSETQTQRTNKALKQADNELAKEITRLRKKAEDFTGAGVPLEGMDTNSSDTEQTKNSAKTSPKPNTNSDKNSSNSEKKQPKESPHLKISG